jgi:hypothetical protein
MDAIQDGFLMLNKLPEPGLLNGIYRHTPATSKLRQFSIAALVYNLRSPEFKDKDINGMVKLLHENTEALTDFVTIIKNFVASKDPRIRDCGGEDGCVECFGKVEGNRREGVWPCEYHEHTSEGADGQLAVDAGCYLWDL